MASAAIVVTEFTDTVAGTDGRAFTARACGRAREDGLWEGWIEFTPTDGGEPLRTRRETTQPGLDDLRYWYQRDGMRIAKVVSFFLLEYIRGEPCEHDPDEVEDARWMALDEAARVLTYRGERGMVALAKVHPACRF